MDSSKNKTKIYLVVFSLAMSTVTFLFFKFSLDAPSEKGKMTPEHQLAALQRSAPKSSEMDRFMKRELDKQSDERQAAEDMSK